MKIRGRVRAYAAPSVVALAAFFVACSSDRGASVGNVDTTTTPPEIAANGATPVNLPSWPAARRPPNYTTGPADLSRSVVQRRPLVQVSRAEISQPLRSIESPEMPAEDLDHEVHKLASLHGLPLPPEGDPVLQSHVPISTMPASILNFKGQGRSTGGVVTGTPPDTNGAVGKNHYVQTVNGGIEIWDKTGTVVAASKALGALWKGYVGTNPGNGCATHNDGDPVVVYDQLADRWFLTQFSLPGNPSNYQCVAVSQTNDPTGAYYLYDYAYGGLNDYGKFAIWPDAYYATYNLFGSGQSYIGADFCAFDRASMLQGLPAAQHCFQQGQNYYGALPVSLEGTIPPPKGQPGFFMQLGVDNQGNLDNTLALWKAHIDWTTPANSTLTGPTSLPVAGFTPTCDPSGTCVPQAGAGSSTLDTLADRLMFRLTYRNFGTHESLLANHSVVAGATGGIRWYEIRSPSTTPVVYQQGTYAPSDANWRWMGSLAQDQAEDFAVGFSISSSTTDPSIAWTGRLNTDALGVMGQGESVLDNGTSFEVSGVSRWGDYSNMTVDPTDDCTFWYTTELYNQRGTSTWDTWIANVKFPSCAANDFTIGASPPAQPLSPGAQVAFTVRTTSTKGVAEPVVLNIQDLPSGVTAVFAPTTVTAGATSTLTLTAAANAPLTGTPGPTFTVIGKAQSAVHAATAQVSVVQAGAPIVSITTPANNAVVSGTTPITATASPAATTTLTSLSISVDGAQVATGAGANQTFNWDTTALANGGVHTLVATAVDADGLSATATVTVRVRNSPLITITAPANGASVGGTVSVTAGATAPTGTTVSTLAILIDGTTVVSASAASVAYGWDASSLANGSSHTIVAIATDADGGTASASVTVTVKNNPSVLVTAPPDGSTVSATVPAIAIASAPAGTTIATLVIKLDGTTLTSATSSPVSINWDTTKVTDGNHVFTAVVTDADGSQATSPPVTVTVANNPADAGAGDGGIDAGTPRDAGTQDTGAGDSGGAADAGSDAGSPPPVAPGGCGCSEVGHAGSTASYGSAGLAILGLALARARRRRSRAGT